MAGRKGSRNSPTTIRRGDAASIDVAQVCAELAAGATGLKLLAKLHDVDVYTLWDALNRDDETRALYYEARRCRATLNAEEIEEEERHLEYLANAVELGLIPADAVKASVAARTAVIKSKSWLMSKRAPQDWGDKQQVEHTGGLTVRITGNFGAP